MLVMLAAVLPVASQGGAARLDVGPRPPIDDERSFFCGKPSAEQAAGLSSAVGQPKTGSWSSTPTWAASGSLERRVRVIDSRMYIKCYTIIL